MTFGQRVRKYRELNEMTQEELAKKAGYAGRSAIAKIEAGDRNASQTTIATLANALGISPTALLFDMEEKELTPEEMQKNMLWDSYSQLNSSDRQLVFTIINRLLGVEFSDEL